MSIRRAVSFAGALIILGVWFVFLRPTFLGGPIGYVIVSGESMEPAYSDGDFVVTRRGEYQVGDVVAFNTGNGPIVIHRIVGGGGDEGFVMQGDNRDTVDQWRPRAVDIEGEAWLRVAGGGEWAAQLRDPRVFAATIGLIVFVSLLTARSRRKGKSVMQPAVVTGRRIVPTPLWALAGFTVVLTAVSALVAAQAFTRSTTQTEVIERSSFTQAARFDYTIFTHPSTLYPEGRIGPVNEQNRESANSLPPVYTRLVQSFDVSFRYQIESSTPAEVAGTYSAVLYLKAGEDGWTRPQDLIAATPFEGPTLEGRVHVELAPLQQMIDTVEKETGVAATFYEIAVVLNVDASGTIEGEAAELTQSAPLVFRMSRSRITPPEAVVVRERESRGDSVTRDRRIETAGLSMPVASARIAAVLGTAGGLALTALLGVVVYTGLGQGEAAKVRLRYGAVIVPVRQAEDNGNSHVEVESLADLGRLAQRDGGVILCQDDRLSRRYFVNEGSTTYEYTVRG